MRTFGLFVIGCVAGFGFRWVAMKIGYSGDVADAVGIVLAAAVVARLADVD